MEDKSLYVPLMEHGNESPRQKRNRILKVFQSAREFHATDPAREPLTEKLTPVCLEDIESLPESHIETIVLYSFTQPSKKYRGRTSFDAFFGKFSQLGEKTKKVVAAVGFKLHKDIVLPHQPYFVDAEFVFYHADQLVKKSANYSRVRKFFFYRSQRGAVTLIGERIINALTPRGHVANPHLGLRALQVDEFERYKQACLRLEQLPPYLIAAFFESLYTVPEGREDLQAETNETAGKIIEAIELVVTHKECKGLFPQLSLFFARIAVDQTLGRTLASMNRGSLQMALINFHSVDRLEAIIFCLVAEIETSTFKGKYEDMLELCLVKLMALSDPKEGLNLDPELLKRCLDILNNYFWTSNRRNFLMTRDTKARGERIPKNLPLFYFIQRRLREHHDVFANYPKVRELTLDYKDAFDMGALPQTEEDFQHVIENSLVRFDVQELFQIYLLHYHGSPITTSLMRYYGANINAVRDDGKRLLLWLIEENGEMQEQGDTYNKYHYAIHVLLHEGVTVTQEDIVAAEKINTTQGHHLTGRLRKKLSEQPIAEVVRSGDSVSVSGKGKEENEEEKKPAVVAVLSAVAVPAKTFLERLCAAVGVSSVGVDNAERLADNFFGSGDSAGVQAREKFKAFARTSEGKALWKEAIAAGDKEILEFFFKYSHVDINEEIPSTGMSSVHWAIECGEAGSIEALISLSYYFSDDIKDGDALLQRAARRGEYVWKCVLGAILFRLEIILLHADYTVDVNPLVRMLGEKISELSERQGERHGVAAKAYAEGRFLNLNALLCRHELTEETKVLLRKQGFSEELISTNQAKGAQTRSESLRTLRECLAKPKFADYVNAWEGIRNVGSLVKELSPREVRKLCSCDLNFPMQEFLSANFDYFESFWSLSRGNLSFAQCVMFAIREQNHGFAEVLRLALTDNEKDELKREFDSSVEKAQRLGKNLKGGLRAVESDIQTITAVPLAVPHAPVVEEKPNAVRARANHKFDYEIVFSSTAEFEEYVQSCSEPVDFQRYFDTCLTRFAGMQVWMCEHLRSKYPVVVTNEQLRFCIEKWYRLNAFAAIEFLLTQGVIPTREDIVFAKAQKGTETDKIVKILEECNLAKLKEVLLDKRFSPFSPETHVVNAFVYNLGGKTLEWLTPGLKLKLCQCDLTEPTKAELNQHGFGAYLLSGVIYNDGDASALEKCKASGVDVHAQDEWGHTALYSAVRFNNNVALQWLVSQGVKPSEKDLAKAEILRSLEVKVDEVAQPKEDSQASAALLGKVAASESAHPVHARRNSDGAAAGVELIPSQTFVAKHQF